MPIGFSWTELGVDAARVRAVNDASLPGDPREFVLYWCMVNHRAEHNHALDAAIALGNHLGLPVVAYQALRPDYPYASDRIHGFILDGLPHFGGGLEKRGIPYWLELPRNPKEHRPRFEAFGRRAAAVVTDLFPSFIIPGHLKGAAKVLKVPLFAVDASCVVPMQRIAERQVGAYALRPKLRKLWPEYRDVLPKPRAVKKASLAGRIDLALPRTALGSIAGISLAEFSLDHSVDRVADHPGGRVEALRRLDDFLEHRLSRYSEERSDPGAFVQSGLSPALHFGWLYAGEVAQACITALGESHPSVQGLLEELLVRRELGFNYCLHTPVALQRSVTSLPPWAQKTLADHGQDARPFRYTRDELDAGKTHDLLWNAAQRELRTEGRIHNYLRMLWGKKILEWSATPQEALDNLAALNDRYALDGRDCVSVSNFMWILGLHDRPFQERPVIGKVRPMSSDRTAKKFNLGPYLLRYGDAHGNAEL